MNKLGVFLRRSGSCLCLAAILLSLCPTAFAATEPTVSAASAVLICGDDGRCLYAKDADTRREMASTTKIMTAIVALENGDLSAVVPIADEAVGVEGSSIYLRRGESMTLSDLLYALLLQSANDAAVAIAVHVGSSVDGFVGMMNEKAEALGLCNTHFENPHGLSEEDHYTTARDLASLAAYALKNTTFRTICATKSAKIKGDRVIYNHNKLLLSYPDAIGVKTGFTKSGGRCLVSAAERDGSTLIAVTLRAPDDWNDHTKMLDYGFSLYETVSLAAVGEFSFRLPVLGGDAETVYIRNRDALTLHLLKSRASVIARPEINRTLFAPVFEGDILGRVAFYCDEKLIATLPLYAEETVERPRPRSLWERIFQK